MLLDIVILPPIDLRRLLARKVKSAIIGHKVKFVVDNIKLIPHLSLFHFKITPNNLNLVYDKIRIVVKNYTPVVIKSISPKANNRTVWFYLFNNSRLKKLNRETVKACSQLRMGMTPWFSEKLSSRDKSYYCKYGVHYNIGNNFKPHFSLVKLDNKEQALMVSKKLSNIKFDFVANVIAVCEVNYNGQVTKILKKFRV